MRDGLLRGLVLVSFLAAVTAAIPLIWYVIKGPGDQGQWTALAAAVIGIMGAVSPVLVWAWAPDDVGLPRQALFLPRH